MSHLCVVKCIRTQKRENRSLLSGSCGQQRKISKFVRPMITVKLEITDECKIRNQHKTIQKQKNHQVY